VFGVPLTSLIDEQNPVPLFVNTLLKRLDNSVKTPGLFRISGSADTINAIRRSIDRGTIGCVGYRESEFVVR
jgi:hypothetical protein